MGQVEARCRVVEPEGGGGADDAFAVGSRGGHACWYAKGRPDRIRGQVLAQEKTTADLRSRRNNVQKEVLRAPGKEEAMFRLHAHRGQWRASPQQIRAPRPALGRRSRKVSKLNEFCKDSIGADGPISMALRCRLSPSWRAMST